ncbi:MAG: hypothetical protein KAT65_24470 [Methanophagales archaeon]|nr:hypothetical protein [Methanophagales archaeon]
MPITFHQWRLNQYLAGGTISLADIDEEKEYAELEENIRTGKPMILATNRHAVVAYKIIKQGDISYILIYNNEKPYDISTGSFYLSFPYATYNLNSQEFNYEGDTKFLVQEAKKHILDRIILSVECPVNVTITDQYNRVISDNGTNEILNATVISTNGTKTFYLPANLTYNVNVCAYDVGNFTLTKFAPVTNETAVITVFEDIAITNKTKAALEIEPNEMDQTMDIDYNGDGVMDEVKYPDVNETITVSSPSAIFDTGTSEKPYPSISGTHTGKIKPNHDVNVTKMYTYPCAGTGGHSESVRIWGESVDVSGTWDGYTSDWHNITFSEQVTLLAGHTYNYSICTGSYPQIHHTANLSTPTGFMTCSEFVDGNGKRYKEGVPAIKLE